MALRHCLSLPARAVFYLGIHPLLAAALFSAGVNAQNAPAAHNTQTFPTRALRIVVPSSAGGTIDIITRAVAQPMAERMGQAIVTENRAAATTILAEEAVARAAPDGYTLMMAGTSRATNPHMHPRLNYDPITDLASVAQVAISGNVLVVNPALPARTVRDLVELARSKPGAMFYGSAAHGSSGHLSAELFNQLADTRITQVPYKGAAPALADLLAGQIQLTFDNIPAAINHIRSGKLRPLGVTSAQRSALLPEVPTIAEAGAESGLRGYEMLARFGLVAPARTPPEVIARLSGEVQAALRQPQVLERFAALGLEPAWRSADEFQRTTVSESARLGKLIREAGVGGR
jgi:tripartite-type tricarboxylate transporter receptor subunit TctC